jgi:hypothetical protein
MDPILAFAKNPGALILTLIWRSVAESFKQTPTI